MSRSPGLIAADVTFSYRRVPIAVVDGFNAEFDPGSMTALTGPSGSGKSTLLYLLGLMVRPQGGQIKLGPERVDHYHDARRAEFRARRFGFIFQDAVLDPTRTVLDNVVETALYRRASRRQATIDAQLLMDRLGVAIRASHRPGEISGGQAQRIAICRALLAAPAVLLADEPTGNLDALTAADVLGALREQADSGATVIIATHDNTIVRACDRRVHLGQAVR